MSLDRFNPSPSTAGLVAQSGPARGAASAISTVIAAHAADAAAFLKAMSHEGRLMILCHLAEGERSVTELEALLGQRQAAVSQQLARLRLEGMVTTRRDGKAIYYSIRDLKVLDLMRALQVIYSEI